MQDTQGNAPAANSAYTFANAFAPTDVFITVYATRNPTQFDFNYPIKKRWINFTTPVSEWVLKSFSNTTGQTLANWVLLSSGGSQSVLQFTVPNGVTPIVPDGIGNVNFTSSAGTVVITGSSASPNNHTINFDITGGLDAIEEVQGDDGVNVGPTNGIIQFHGNVVNNGTHSPKPVFFLNNGTSIEQLDIQVTTNTGGSAKRSAGLASFLITQFAVDSNGFVTLAGGTTPPLLTLSDNAGTKVQPDGTGNIQLEGQLNQQSGSFATTVSNASSHLINTNPMSSARWIVDPLSTTANPNGTHTTIGAALSSASSGDTILIMPGTYTENLTLKAGVNLAGQRGDSTTPNVIIVGKATASFSGTASISNIQLQTNSDFALVVSGSSATILRLNNCNLNCANNTGISYTSSSSSSSVILSQCGGNLATTGIALFASSSPGVLAIGYSSFSNTGGSTTANTVSAGELSINHSIITNPITSSSTGICAFEHSDINSGAQNVTAFTHGGASTSNCFLCDFASGSATAISISSTLMLANCVINSAHASSAIGGSGSLTYEGLFFSSSQSSITTSSQTGGTIQGSTFQNPTQQFLGESVSNTATSVSATSNTPLTITSITLTPGVWDVTCIATAQAAGGTVLNSALVVNLSTTNNTITGTLGIDTFQTNVAASVLSGVVPPIRKTITTNTTYYLVANVIYTSTSSSVNGRINATRVG